MGELNIMDWVLNVVCSEDMYVLYQRYLLLFFDDCRYLNPDKIFKFMALYYISITF